MVSWCDLYAGCKYFSYEYYAFDIFGHDSIIQKCKLSGIEKEINPRIFCKECKEMKRMLKEEQQ